MLSTLRLDTLQPLIYRLTVTNPDHRDFPPSRPWLKDDPVVIHANPVQAFRWWLQGNRVQAERIALHLAQRFTHQSLWDGSQ